MLKINVICQYLSLRLLITNLARYLHVLSSISDKNCYVAFCHSEAILRVYKLPKSFTPELQEKIFADLRKGFPISNILALLMIDDSTFELAMRVREFREKINESKAKYIRPVMDKVLGTAADSIENAWRLLERKAKDDFGKGSTEDERTINVRVRTFDAKGKVKK